MNKPTKSLLLAALIAVAPAAYAQAQLTDGVPETNPALITGSTFNVDATNQVPLSFTGDTTGATVSQINVLNGGQLSANNNNFDFTEINIESGGDTSNSITIQNAELNVLPGGSIGAILTVGPNSTLNVGSGVTDIGNNITVAGTATANINSGRSGVNFDTLAGSTVNIGGTADIAGNDNDFAGVVNISGDAQISGSTDFTTTSNATVTGGTFGTQVEFLGGVNISGGSFGSGLDIAASATNAVITDGTFDGTVDFFAPVTVNGGDFGNSADFEVGSAGSIVNGGTFGTFADINDDLTINGGSFGRGTDIGNSGDTSPVNAGGGPNVTINGGNFNELDVDSGVVDIFGGTFTGGPTGDAALTIGARGDQNTIGTVNLHGGDFQGFIEAFGDLNLYGTNFAIDGTPLAGLSSFDVNNGPNNLSVLTGTLEDGSTISLNLNQGFFFVSPTSNPLDIDGNLSSFFTDVNEGDDFFGLPGGFGGTLTAGGTTINIIAVPEPGSFSLLALGALGLISRRRRS